MGHADTLLAMGGAFLAAAFLARLGSRIGLPTIPLFMLAGILLGPHTPAWSWSRTRTTSRCCRRSVSSCCSSTSAWSSTSTT
ncbi:hypothetical protein SHIRM173S_10288 [Streptomyces hirsutus]